jgi:hypothetical protein
MGEIEKNVEILIKSFLRPQSVMRCVDSIRRHYPNITISVCDDGDLHKVDGATNTYKLPYYSGSGVGRNYLVKLCSKPYFFMTEDDMEFTDKTDISKLYSVITSNNNIGVVSCNIYDVNDLVLKSGPGHLKVNYDSVTGRTIVRTYYGKNAPKHLISGIPCTVCRMTANTFMGSTLLFREWGIKWRDEMKRCDHLPFYLDFPKKIRIYHVDDVVIDHHHDRPEGYAQVRDNPFYHKLIGERCITYAREYD